MCWPNFTNKSPVLSEVGRRRYSQCVASAAINATSNTHTSSRGKIWDAAAQKEGLNSEIKAGKLAADASDELISD